MFKKKIGISQSIIKHPKYNETISALDLEWTKLLKSVNMLSLPLPIIEPGRVASISKIFNLDGIILSGGNSCADYVELGDSDYEASIQRDIYEKNLISDAIANKIPILGVCRGLQLINLYFGGKMQRCNDHAGTSHKINSSRYNDIFQFKSTVNSYHNFSIPLDLLSSQLVPIAFDTHTHVEAAKHESYKIYGIMWHPERNKPFHREDKKLIKRIFE